MLAVTAIMISPMSKAAYFSLENYEITYKANVIGDIWIKGTGTTMESRDLNVSTNGVSGYYASSKGCMKFSDKFQVNGEFDLDKVSSVEIVEPKYLISSFTSNNYSGSRVSLYQTEEREYVNCTESGKIKIDGRAMEYRISNSDTGVHLIAKYKLVYEREDIQRLAEKALQAYEKNVKIYSSNQRAFEVVQEDIRNLPPQEKIKKSVDLLKSDSKKLELTIAPLGSSQISLSGFNHYWDNSWTNSLWTELPLEVTYSLNYVDSNGNQKSYTLSKQNVVYKVGASSNQIPFQPITIDADKIIDKEILAEGKFNLRISVKQVGGYHNGFEVNYVQNVNFSSEVKDLFRETHLKEIFDVSSAYKTGMDKALVDATLSSILKKDESGVTLIDQMLKLRTLAFSGYTVEEVEDVVRTSERMVQWYSKEFKKVNSKKGSPSYARTFNSFTQKNGGYKKDGYSSVPTIRLPKYEVSISVK